MSPFLSISLLPLLFVSFNAKSSWKVLCLVGKTGSLKCFAGFLVRLAVLVLIWHLMYQSSMTVQISIHQHIIPVNILFPILTNVVLLISDDNCCLFNNSHCGKPWILSYSCIPGIVYSLHSDAVRCLLQLSQDWTVPQGVNQPATESLSNWHRQPSSLVGRSNTPHRSTIFCQPCSITVQTGTWIGLLAGQEGRKACSPTTSAPTSCGSETVLQVPGSVGMYLDSCRTWARGWKKAVSRQTCPDL